MTSSVIYDGNLRTICTHLRSGSIIETDAPVDNKGKGERFSPTDLVATALASCMLTTMGIRSAELDVDLEGIKIEVEKIMRADPRRMAGINLTFYFPDYIVLTGHQQAVLQRTAETCPVIYSIHPDIEVKVKFNWPVTADRLG